MGRNEEEKKRLCDIIENQEVEFQSERENLESQITILKQEIESLTMSLSASNRALEAMRRRHRTNPKDEQAALVRSQLEEWEQERKTLSMSSPVTRISHDDVEPVTFHQHHDCDHHSDHVKSQQNLDEMLQEAQKIEKRIRRKHDGNSKKKKKKKAATSPSPYAP